MDRKRLTMWLALAATLCAAPALAQAPADQEKAEQARRDQRRIAVQKICPVTGNELGTHGEPVKARVGKEVLHFCCAGCLEGEIDPRHWATIHQNFADAQKICPVMKHELPGKPKWTIVDGKIIFVCCPPCTEKIQAKPKAYLTQLDRLYQRSLESSERR